MSWRGATTEIDALMARMAGEYAESKSILGIPEGVINAAFRLEAVSPGLEVMGRRISLPVGPAAGPHSQLAPNIAAAYLAGARVIELKTVQVNDALEIDKPCIYALDEGQNTEWSTELTLKEAREEYLRGWIAANLLGAILAPMPTAEPPRRIASWQKASPEPGGLIFNLSVGYTLEGIKSPAMDAFIEGMRAPTAGVGDSWADNLERVARFVVSNAFINAFGGPARDRALALLGAFPDRPIHSVTLSTMHGCPPDEIERIARYLLLDKGIDVSVKLNPTLLGHRDARRILDACGWRHIEIHEDNFEKDLQWPQAIDLIWSLSAAAKAGGRRFGLKLSNTLANVNDGAFLPGGERYLSGRALYPLTVELAARLAAALPDWPRRFSFCGGVSARNARALIAAGLGPLTVATELLKPGGYARLLPIAREAVAGLASARSGLAAVASNEGRPDGAALRHLADAALLDPAYHPIGATSKPRIARPLPAADCFAAPCVEACPAHQQAPVYIRAGATGRNDAAMAIIVRDNALPTITGVLCDHVCQQVCSRNDYEGPVLIRDAKLACVRATGRRTPAISAELTGRIKVAVIGAGPAGLACASRLAEAGVAVTIFEQAENAGGVISRFIPRFRISQADIEADIDVISALGVDFRFGVRIDDLRSLRTDGYEFFFLGTGAWRPRPLKLVAADIPIIDALKFLEAVRCDDAFASARSIVVVGGGNTAMDAVRAAVHLPAVETVHLSYRRTGAEMPADREEREAAFAEAVAKNATANETWMELSLPETTIAASAGKRAQLVLRQMRLGAVDASGRRAAEPTDETFSVDCDLLVSAVGEMPDRDWLRAIGLKLDADGLPIRDAATGETGLPGVFVGGDVARGPASIIQAVADGRRTADAILRRMVAGGSAETPAAEEAERTMQLSNSDIIAVLSRRGELLPTGDPATANFLKTEVERCLACDVLCLRCVEVCPNRANIAIKVPAIDAAIFRQSIQILHLDYLCNQCGNCGLFCPWDGDPCKDKPALFATIEALEASAARGFAFTIDGRYYRFLTGGETTGAADDIALVALADIVERDYSYLPGVRL